MLADLADNSKGGHTMTKASQFAVLTIVLKEALPPADSQSLIVTWTVLFDLTGNTMVWRQLEDRVSFRDRRDHLEAILEVLKTGDLDDTAFYLGEQPSEGTNTRRYLAASGAFDPKLLLEGLLKKIDRVELQDVS